jgi:hypothetical protein
VLAALLWFLSDRSAREAIRKIGENQSSSEARLNVGYPLFTRKTAEPEFPGWIFDTWKLGGEKSLNCAMLSLDKKAVCRQNRVRQEMHAVKGSAAGVPMI